MVITRSKTFFPEARGVNVPDDIHPAEDVVKVPFVAMFIATLAPYRSVSDHAPEIVARFAAVL
jgi:hypothetical protein